MPAGPARRLKWAPRAVAAFEATLAHIAGEDPRTAELVVARVEHSLELLRRNPGLGTLTAARGVRRYPVPRTGHVLNYRVRADSIVVLRWYRARQNVPR
jgi:plasmid stabilization system protein ParE